MVKNAMQHQASVQKNFPKMKKSTTRQSLDMSLGGKSKKGDKIKVLNVSPYFLGGILPPNV